MRWTCEVVLAVLDKYPIVNRSRRMQQGSSLSVSPTRHRLLPIHLRHSLCRLLNPNDTATPLRRSLGAMPHDSLESWSPYPFRPWEECHLHNSLCPTAHHNVSVQSDCRQRKDSQLAGPNTLGQAKLDGLLLSTWFRIRQEAAACVSGSSPLLRVLWPSTTRTARRSDSSWDFACMS